MCPTWRHIAVVLCAAFGLPGQIGFCLAQSSEVVRPRNAPSAGLLSPQAEARIGEALRRAVTQDGGAAPKILAGRKIAALTYREAMQRGIERNLSVQFQKQAMVEAGAVAEGSKAAFDPVAGVSTNYQRNFSNDRTDLITRVHRGAPDLSTFSQQFQQWLAAGSPPGGAPNSTIATCSVIVDGKQVPNAFSDPTLCAYVPTTALEYASSRGIRPDESAAIVSQGSKLMNYGGLLSLSFQTAYTPKQSSYVGINATDVAFIDRTNA